MGFFSFLLVNKFLYIPFLIIIIIIVCKNYKTFPQLSELKITKTEFNTFIQKL